MKPMNELKIRKSKHLYQIADIGMRMLQPHELFAAQGFSASYIIDQGPDGTKLSKSDQVRMCGNSVCPPVAAALVQANCADMAADQKYRIMEVIG